jgi:hypothetical protein
MFFNEPIDNSGLVIPYYTEIPPDALYPCGTARMRYDKGDHRYYLTEAALSHYGVNFEPEQAERLCRAATGHIYSYIELMAQTKYNLMCYRIAKSLFGRHKSKREGRQELERKLAVQAEFIADYGDARKTPKLTVNPETGRLKETDNDSSNGFWLHDDVLNWLNVNYLTDCNATCNPWEINWNEY